LSAIQDRQGIETANRDTIADADSGDLIGLGGLGLLGIALLTGHV
jgi:hypothetical protein